MEIFRQTFSKKCKEAKSSFYQNMIKDLKTKNPSQWYSMLKRMSSYDQGKAEDIVVTEISHLSNQEQVEAIADRISAVSQEYEPLRKEDIEIPYYSEESIPQFSVQQVREIFLKMKVKKATAPGDIPAKFIKDFAFYLAIPFTDYINCSIRPGQCGSLYKYETITPVPKVNSPGTIDDLRPISNLFNFYKLAEALISELIISDMEPFLDTSQYGNQRKTSIQHYLIKMIHRIMSSVDKNQSGDINAVCLTLYDYRQAFFTPWVRNGSKSHN